MASDTTIICPATCQITVVHDLALPPLQLDANGGALIAGAILAIWSIGFCFRALIRVLSLGGNSTTENHE